MSTGRRELLTLALDLLEQLGVLDRQHRLISKRLDQIDGIGLKGARRLPADHKPADQAVLAQQRHGQQRAIPGLTNDVVEGVARFLIDIGDLHRATLESGAADGPLAQMDRPSGQGLDDLGGELVSCLNLEHLSVRIIRAKHTGVGVGECYGVTSDGAEHRLKLQGGVNRAADVAQRLQLADRALELQGALLDLAFEVGVGLLELAGHLVEVLGERLELVSGVDLDPAREIAPPDPSRPVLQRPDRPRETANVKPGKRDEQNQH